jgi:hypothetical protein
MSAEALRRRADMKKFLAPLLAIVLAAPAAFTADVKGKVIRGNLVYWDTHEKRLIDAIGPDVTQYANDFSSGGPGVDTAFDTDWTVTRVEAGAGESTMVTIDGVGGVLQITTDAADNDGINAQVIGEAFKLAAGNTLYFGARIKASATTQNDFFIGLAITDTDILGGVTDRIGFEKLDAVTAVKAMLEKDSTETLSGTLSTLDTSYHTYEFYYDGSTVEFFIDGVSVYKPAVTNLPNDEELRVSIHGLAGEAVAKTFDVDWIRCVQIGGRL